MRKFFPHVGDYRVEYCNVYMVSQLVAKTFRAGRVCLVGDAAHVNNPIGGMGMNGGIHDAVNLAGKLAPVVHGEAGEDLLDLYSRQRRFAAVEYVQAQTIANKKLLEERDPEVRRHNLAQLGKTRRKPGHGEGVHAPRVAPGKPSPGGGRDLTGVRSRPQRPLGTAAFVETIERLCRHCLTKRKPGCKPRVVGAGDRPRG